ncbi:MAG: efflux RND transporter periplasmic adaptor subunit [Microscillaceae bacterium]|jgi:RND family efflux transporter MFP subunit|nr:efflux RND transporter periplasmic adaptor subunit [Microscillaceae bacterium]
MKNGNESPLTPGGGSPTPALPEGEEIRIPPPGARGLWVILGLLFLVACGKTEKTARAEYQELIEAVYASGSIIPKNEYKVFSLADGIITQKMVSEGDVIKAGQTLFQIASDAQDARLRNSQENLRLAQSNYQDNSPVLRELKIALENSRIKLKNDSINYFRYKSLYENQASSRADYDRANLTYQTAQNDYIGKRNNYEKVKNDLYINWQNAQSQYVVSAQDEANYLISSRIQGRVFEIYKEQGEVVKRNDVVALLGDDKAVYLKLSVDELDIPKVKIGQEIIVKIDIFKDQVFKAKVSKIYPRLNSADQSFRVDAEFASESPTIYSGLSIEANIIIQKKSRTLTIAKSLIYNGDTVMVKRNGKPEKIKIKKGLETLDRVEILGGISEKDEIMF